MNLSQLQSKLLEAARRSPPAEHVPYAFERRVMARLTSAPLPNEWLAWTRALWFGAVACTAIAVLAIVWAAPAAANPDPSFSDGVEDTIMASTDDLDSAW
jgi:hypothetical protein